MVVDAGARGGLKKEWLALHPYLQCIGFEPDPAEYERLRQTAANASQISYRQSGLWDSRQELSLHLTEKEGLSSVYFPNEKFLKHFGPLNIQGYGVQRKVPMEVARLDEVLSGSEARAVDFIKIDVEGAALEILRGAEGVFKEGTVTGLRIEAEFNPKYSGQHLFSEVDEWLRPFDYQLFDFKTCRWKRKTGFQTGGTSGQPVHGDFIYFMDFDAFFRKIERLSIKERSSKTTKFLIFLCLYGIYDAALELIDEASKREILSREEAEGLKNDLGKTQSFLMRIPKLQGRSLASDWFYHFLMLAGGLWLERKGFWKPEVELRVS